MYILGISCWGRHASAAALLKDGEIIACSNEERFSRIRYTDAFPHNAIDFCLKQANITRKEIDFVSFHMNPWINLLGKITIFLKYFPKSILFYFANKDLPLNDRLNIRSIILKEIDSDSKIKVYGIQHHLTHAASAFLVSPFEESAILTIDGKGEYHTTLLAYGKENSIIPLRKIQLHHSLGLVYSTLTSFLGFRAVKDEGKVMGLAAYGNATYYEAFKDMIKLEDKGRFCINIDYFNFTRSGVDLENRLNYASGKFLKVFGKPRDRREPINQRHKNIACSLQRRLEEIGIHITNYLHSITKSKNLCLAGGVALNCVMNGKIIKNTDFKNIFIQPASDDTGCALGGAFYIYNVILGYKRNYEMADDYLGPEYSDKEYMKALNNANLNYEKIENIEKEVALLLSKNKIVGWFQGRMEYGPRALGNRSILANPCNPHMKKILNQKVKRRESFRPYAPSVLEEKYKEYFDLENLSPFMLLACKVREEKKKIIPAVTHVDNTARVQTVSRYTNPRYWKLIKEFERTTGIPVVLNTSFNLRGEPIVCTPYDAISCFNRSEMDYLVLGKFLVSKNEIF